MCGSVRDYSWGIPLVLDSHNLRLLPTNAVLLGANDGIGGSEYLVDYTDDKEKVSLILIDNESNDTEIYSYDLSKWYKVKTAKQLPTPDIHTVNTPEAIYGLNDWIYNRTILKKHNSVTIVYNWPRDLLLYIDSYSPEAIYQIELEKTLQSVYTNVGCHIEILPCAVDLSCQGVICVARCMNNSNDKNTGNDFDAVFKGCIDLKAMKITWTSMGKISRLADDLGLSIISNNAYIETADGVYHIDDLYL